MTERVSDARLAELATWKPGAGTKALSAQREEWQAIARELQSRRALSGPMAPIARVTVEQRGTTVASGGKLPNHVITRGTMYAPGLPPGEYDLYPEPPQRDPAPEGESA